MENTVKLLFGAILLFGVVDLGNGLKCYSCAYVETGNLDLIDGFAGATQDASCEWGRQPDDRFLVDCPPYDEADPVFRYFQSCVFTRMNGKLQAQEAEFNGTLWSCATRRQAINPPDSSNKVTLFKEFKQGRLADVTRDFQDLTGKEVLQNLSKIFYNEVTNTKFVSCDADACVQLEEPVTDATTTSTVETTPLPGLMCYSCVYSQSDNSHIISEFANTMEDASCAWGRTPDRTFLTQCPPNYEGIPGFVYACVSMEIHGMFLTQNREYNGTIRQCSRSGRKPSVILENDTNAFSEYRQGLLAQVIRDFQDSTGKKFLQDMSTVFDDLASQVKIISCDVDACKELGE